MSRWFWQYSGTPWPEVDEDDIPSFNAITNPPDVVVTGDAYLEITGKRLVKIMVRDKQGLPIASVTLPDLVESGLRSTRHKAAEASAKVAGYERSDVWWGDDDFEWAKVVPSEFVIKIVGGPFNDAELLKIARDAGFNVKKVDSRKVDFEAGSTNVSFVVDEPPNIKWQWEKWYA